MRLPVRAAGLLACCLALAGCRHLGDAPAAAPGMAAAPAASAAADDNLNAVLWMQASTEYRAAATQTYRAAVAQLDAALADPHWDALAPAERANPAVGLKPAVIVDIDETVLDNSPYQARLVLDGQEYGSASWAAWVAEQQAKPIPGVIEFARAASERGVTLVYVSNRTQDQRAASIANLRAVGLPVADDSVYLGKGLDVAGCTQPTSGDKQCRRQLVGRSYRVLMQFGDQLGDFVAIADRSGPARQALMDRHGDWFGQRWWMLPNPSYGDWQSAVFDEQWNLPVDARRSAKRAAIDPAR